MQSQKEKHKYYMTSFCKENIPVHPKGSQLWMFTGRLDAEAEAPILWPPDAKSQLTGKDSDPGKDWRQKEKGVTEGEMVGWHHRLNGREFEKASGNSGGQRSPVCCSPWTSTGGSFFWEPCSTLSTPFTRLSTSPSQEMCSSSLCNLRVLHVTSDMEEMWKQGQWYHKIKSDKGDQKQTTWIPFLGIYIYEKKTKATNWKRHTHSNVTAAFLQ